MEKGKTKRATTSNKAKRKTGRNKTEREAQTVTAHDDKKNTIRWSVYMLDELAAGKSK